MPLARATIESSVQRYFTVLDALDVESALACFADDAVLECLSDDRRAAGKEEIRSFLHGVTDGSVEMLHEVTLLIADPAAGSCATLQKYRDQRTDGTAYDELTCNFFQLNQDGRFHRVQFFRGGTART